VNKKQRVIMLATDFPPLAGTNVQRTQGFVRYLPQQGWVPVVITGAIEDMQKKDTRQLDGLPQNLDVRRINSPDPFLWWRRRQKKKPVDVSASVEPQVVAEKNHKKSNIGVKTLVVSVTTRLAKLALKKFWYLPDAHRPWAGAAAREVVRCIRKEGATALVTSSPAYSCHVAGLYIKRRTGIPWVADFTDLWINRPGREVPGRWHSLMDRRLEAAVVRAADRIIVASPPWRERLVNWYGDWVREKIVCITLGYEREKVAQSSPHNQKTGTKFVHTGAMYSSETPAPFLQALGEVKQQNPKLVENVQVRLIGYAGDELPRLKDIIRVMSLDEHVQLPGILPRARCLEEQAAADVLLLFNGPEHLETIRGKSYEYMATGKPILALTPKEGAQARILRGAGTACIVDHGDIPETKKAIEALLAKDMTSRLIPDWEYIQKYDVEVLSERLAEVLNEVARQ